MLMNEQNLSPDVQFSSFERSIERDKIVLANNKELLNQLQQIDDNCKKEVRDTLGSKYEEYMLLRKKIHNQFLEMRHLFTPTMEGEKARKEFNRTSSAEKKKFVASLGNDFVTVKNIQKKYKKQSTLAVEKVMNIIPTPYVDTDAPVLDDTVSPWTYKVPPYYDSSGLLARINKGTVLYSSSSHYENAATGEIGSRAFMKLYEEEENSVCMSFVRSDISELFYIPVAGLIEVYVYLQCLDSSYNTYIFDEIGFSELRLYQYSKVYLEEVNLLTEGRPPDRRYVTLLDIQRDDDDEDEYTSGDMALPGNYLYPHIFSTHSYATGELVMMKIGVENYQYVKVNDYTCQGILNSQWFVSKIAYRSTGNP